ncbi:quorum-quenching N-acyl homoserine lactonase AiiA [Paenibacillus polymyxa]|uniref:quorum-quenching N-acyl homoserine lactonase AiiA n=1 Tax=Paenibacillus polymyxa TaxID=1406 RepID=UPI002379EC69|nr:N-acyl homoserine lactonase family protein [Paenibacillus polymyxa]WDM24272.1 N-acyl homoserine lactonase family protein [Paenibacillus polymyxa]
MHIKKLYFLPVGECFLDQSAVNRTLAPGKLVGMPVWSFLLETTSGPILIDTGMPDAFINNPDYYKGTRREGRVVPNMSDGDSIVNVLKRVGYRPDDIQMVISSHLHLDHSGGNGHFRNTPILIQRAEYDAAINNEDYSPLECRLPDLQYQIIEGDHELIPGVQILFTPGHSPGHQSVLVATEKSGPVLLTIDVAYTRENFENSVPFLTFDQEMAAKSITRMQELILDVRPSYVFLGHDRDQAQKCRTFPDFL